MTVFTSDSSAPVPESPGQAPFQITHERGPMTRQVRQAALTRGGVAAWEALLATVSPACRARFEPPVGYYEWVESGLALELHDAWARQQGMDDMAERGQAAAREMLGTVQRWILGLASTAFVVENIPRLVGFYYRGGQMRVVRQQAGHAELTFHASGYPDSWFAAGLPSGLAEGLTLTGAAEVKVAYFPPPQASEGSLHRYEIHWKP